MDEQGKNKTMSKIVGKKNKKDITIISVYNARNWKEIKDIIKTIVEKKKEENIIGEDFNTSIGEEGKNKEEGWEISRKSKDKKKNNKGRKCFRIGRRYRKVRIKWYE